MGLNEFLGRWAVRRAHVLVVEVPGAAAVRMALEQGLAARSWVSATSPADADVLAVCGAAGPRMSTAIENVWNRMPGPRTRIDVVAASHATAALDRAAAALLDTDAHRRDAVTRPDPWTDPAQRGRDDADESSTDDVHDADQTPHDDRGDGDMDDMDDMGGMDMPMPGGIGLAGGGEDRDGLEMDVLHVPLGPVLPHWPPGLVLTCTLQGDVVVHATAEVVDPAPDRGAPGTGDARRDVLVARCDAVAGLLAVAGWDSAAEQSRRLRNAALDGAALSECASGVTRLTRRISRSRMLRWSLRELRTAPRPRTGPEPPARSDPHAVELPDRLRGWLDEALAAARTPERAAVTAEPEPMTPTALPALVTGLDLSAVRLVVAGTDVGADLGAATTGEAGDV